MATMTMVRSNASLVPFETCTEPSIRLSWTFGGSSHSNNNDAVTTALNSLLMVCAGWPESSTFKVNVKGPGLGGASGQQAFPGKRDSFRKIAHGHAPLVGRNAASSMKKQMEFHSGFDCGQRLVYDSERRNLRGEQAAKTNQDGSKPNDSDEIHIGSFDFTLGTA